MLADLKSSTNGEVKSAVFAIARTSAGDASLALALLLAFALLDAVAFEGLLRIVQTNL